MSHDIASPGNASANTVDPYLPARGEGEAGEPTLVAGAPTLVAGAEPLNRFQAQRSRRGPSRARGRRAVRNAG
jgi:hypothetical protein